MFTQLTIIEWAGPGFNSRPSLYILKGMINPLASIWYRLLFDGLYSRRYGIRIYIYIGNTAGLLVYKYVYIYRTILYTIRCVYTAQYYNNAQINAVVLPPSTVRPKLWVELLTFVPGTQSIISNPKLRDTTFVTLAYK